MPLGTESGSGVGFELVEAAGILLLSSTVYCYELSNLKSRLGQPSSCGGSHSFPMVPFGSPRSRQQPVQERSDAQYAFT